MTVTRLFKKPGPILLCLSTLFGLSACSVDRPPIRLASQVDLERFMGPWYVIANIPTFIETEAFNAVETYRRDPDGGIATTFTFRQGGFEGPERQYHPKGQVVDPASGAVWTMTFLWPFRSDFRIVYVSPDYSTTVIGREARDYVWIMARTPTLSEDTRQFLIDLVVQEGYDRDKIQLVPQRW